MSQAWDDLIRRHELTFAEAVRIRDEVGAGRAFAEPHVRAAAVDWAGHLLEREGLAALWASRWRRVLLVVFLVVVLAEVARGVLELHGAERPSGARIWLLTAAVAWNVLAVWNRKRLLRETIRHNQGPTDGVEHGP